MILYIDNHEFLYELEGLCRVFFPARKIKVLKGYDKTLTDDIIVYTGAIYDEEEIKLKIAVDYFNKQVEKNISVSHNDNNDITKSCELAFAKNLFTILCKLTGLRPDWGILTGVRPIKLARRVRAEHATEEQAKRYFTDEFLVTKEKTDFAFKVMNTEQEKILSLSKKESFSLYISIPFCPSRCSYCSFVSQSIEKACKTLPKYFELLLQEIKYTGELVRKLKLRLETVYIGGGTPTVLEADRLKILIDEIKQSFDMSTVREFTVEAGRPDTITEEKLLAIKNNIYNNILRISINPQTMNDEVLEAIGRKHTTEQTVEAFLLAKKLGLKNINTDLIVGLPKDTLASFKNSLTKILSFDPASITIHTLAIKKSAYITDENYEKYLNNCSTAKAMLDFAYKTLEKNGYSPYYSYRQSRMVGNLENTGFAKEGFEGLYNAYIMDETHTILACGASAVSKLQQYKTNYLKRIFNFKFSYEYISRFDEIISRKAEIERFYNEYF